MAKDWKNYTDAKNISKILSKHDTILIYDMETSGLDKKKDRILQFSAARYSLPDYRELGYIDLYIKAPFSVDGLKATAVNHITDELLEEKGLEEDEAFDIIKNFISKDDLIAGYNNKRFDDSFMSVLYREHGEEFAYADDIDVYLLVKWIIPENEMLQPDEEGKLKPSYKLCYATAYYDKDNKVNFHSAISDVEATAFVLQKSVEKMNALISDFEEEENGRKAVPRRDALVKSASLFAPSQRIRRVYVNTDQGTVYYDDAAHTWKAKTGSIDSLNMESILRQVLDLYGITDEKDLYRAAEEKDRIDKAKKTLAITGTFNADDLDRAFNEAVRGVENPKRIEECEKAVRVLKKTL